MPRLEVHGAVYSNQGDSLFAYETWDLYKAALELRKLVGKIGKQAPRGSGSDVDHLRRGSSSILFNLAEGYGHFSKGKKLEHYRIALGSAHECHMALGVLALDMPRNRWIPKARALCDRIVAMLTNLIKKIEGR
ncbi:MAG: four helix bundle protein [Longimicrobiales bacterium]